MNKLQVVHTIPAAKKCPKISPKSTGILGNRPYNSLRLAAFPAPALWIALN
jgi:hypothetical protein